MTAHETAHILRKDGLVNVLAELTSILYWFNPVAWGARGILSRLAELACDETAAITTGDRINYARQLLEIAKQVRTNRFQPGIAMAARSEIGHRIEKLIDLDRPLAKNVSWLFVATLVLVSVPSLIIVAAASPHFYQAQDLDDQAGIYSDWIRSDGDKTVLKFRCNVQMPTGDPVMSELKASVVATNWDNVARRVPVDVIQKGNELEFEVATPGTAKTHVCVFVSTTDNRLAGNSIIVVNDLRNVARNGFTIELKEPRRQRVKVVDEGKPVAGANVHVSGSWGSRYVGKTDEEGVFHYVMPKDIELRGFSAWTNDSRIGGFMFHRDPPRDPKAGEHEIELHPCRKQKVRLVNENGKPIAGLGFELHVAVNKNFIDMNGKADFVSDENGEAIFEWYPDWDEVHCYAEFFDRGWFKTEKTKIENEVLIISASYSEQLAGEPISGRVLLPARELGGFAIRLSSFQHPEENRYDLRFVRCDKEGNFTTNVIPGATYCISLTDTDWVAESWTGIPTELDENNPLVLKPIEGEPVEVSVVDSRGKPIEDVCVSLSSKVRFSWKENGETHDGSGGRKWQVFTDKYGMATTTATIGDLRATIIQPQWRPETETKVEAGNSTKIEFRRPAAKRKLAGIVEHTSTENIDVENTEVKLFIADGQSRGNVTAQTNADGKFEFELAGDKVLAFAKTPDGNFAGSVVSANPDDGLRISLKPTMSYQGRLLHGDQPASGKWVRMVAKLEDTNGPENRLVRNQFDVDTVETMTNEQGYFELTDVPTGIKLILRSESDEESERGKYHGERLLTLNENRPLDVIRVGGTPATKPKKSLAEKLADHVANCRVANINALIVIDGPGDKVGTFIRSHCYDTDENKDLLSYLPMWIGGATAENKEKRIQFFQELGWKIPEANHIMIAILSGSGEQLSAQDFDLSTDEVAGQVAAYVSKYAPAHEDANKKLADAMALAKSSGRKVWIRFSQTRCGPCYSFSRWLDEEKATLENDYVLLKIDTLLDDGGWELEQRFAEGKNFGIPNHFILDDQGKAIISSESLLGNIGDPGDFEGLQHFRKMLETTANKLSPDDIDQLVESKGNHSE